MSDMDNSRNDRSRAFGDTVAMDLAAGRAVDLAELYALDAVTEQEREAIDRYISTAPETERRVFLERVRQSREALVRTFRAEEEPPSDLFQRIVAQLPAQFPGQDGLTGEGAQVPAGSTALPPRPGPQDDLAEARKRREQRRGGSGTRRWLVGVAAAAAIALGGVGVGAYMADQNDPVNQVARANDLREASVNVVGGGKATLLISASEDAAVVKMSGVPAPPAGKVYQMWLIPKDGSAPVSQGLMDEQALSKPAVVQGIHSAASLGITVEPAGGSKAPTLPTVAAAPLGA
jgi:anti-sigma-K factor RskA